MKAALYGFRKIISFVILVVALLVALMVCVKAPEESIMFVAGMFGAFCTAIGGAFVSLMSGFKGAYAAGLNPMMPPAFPPSPLSPSSSPPQ
jgi:hypothetical protein